MALNVTDRKPLPKLPMKPGKPGAPIAKKPAPPAAKPALPVLDDAAAREKRVKDFEAEHGDDSY